MAAIPAQREYRVTVTRGRLIIAALAAAATVALAAGSSVQASTTIGETADSGSGGLYCEYGGTYIQRTSTDSRYAAPFDGVITSWQNGGFWGRLSFKVARLGGGSSYTVIASDGPRDYTATAQAVQTYPVRIQVRQGDVIGANVPIANQLCFFDNGGTETYGLDDANTPAGGSGSFDSTGVRNLPIQATIERDRDGDGYGDETQDGCPTNAATQGGCPPPTVLGQLITPFSGVQSCSAQTRVVTSSPGVVSAAPSDGVITSWSHLASATVGTGTIKLKMFRPTGGSNYTVVDVSAAERPTPSTVNTYPARIPVRQGDRVGLAVNDGVVPCSQFTAPGTYGTTPTDIPAGGSGTFSTNNGSLDISAVLEADADGDGFGDSSQDACPTDATTQAQCRTTPPAGDDACKHAKAKLDKAKAKLRKLRKAKAPAKKIKGAKAKVKKAKDGVKKAC